MAEKTISQGTVRSIFVLWDTDSVAAVRRPGVDFSWWFSVLWDTDFHPDVTVSFVHNCVPFFLSLQTTSTYLDERSDSDLIPEQQVADDNEKNKWNLIHKVSQKIRSQRHNGCEPSSLWVRDLTESDCYWCWTRLSLELDSFKCQAIGRAPPLWRINQAADDHTLPTLPAE